MALIRCPECNNEVNSQAPICPKCGYPLNNRNNNTPQKSSTTAVHVIAIIYLVVFIISLIIFLILWFAKYLTFLDCLIFAIPGVISLILLFSLDDAIQRITVLENKLMEKGVVTESELNLYEPPTDIIESPVELADKGIIFCKNCNYQLFPEDIECPNCGTKVERVQDENTDNNEETPDNKKN